MAISLNTLHYYKEMHSGHKIIYVHYLNMEFIFRTLTRREHFYISTSGESPLDMEDTICSTACLYPEGIDFKNFGFAGFSSYVSNVILTNSDVTDVNDIVKKYNEYKQINDLETQCKDLIKAFIPEYSYEEMDDWSWDRLMFYTTRAENIAKLKGFDWHLELDMDKVNNNLNTANIGNEEYVDKLIQSGIDPMLYFKDELSQGNWNVEIENPVIMGNSWNNEGLINDIQGQIRKGQSLFI